MLLWKKTTTCSAWHSNWGNPTTLYTWSVVAPSVCWGFSHFKEYTTKCGYSLIDAFKRLLLWVWTQSQYLDCRDHRCWAVEIIDDTHVCTPIYDDYHWQSRVWLLWYEEGGRWLQSKHYQIRISNLCQAHHSTCWITIEGWSKLPKNERAHCMSS